MVSHISEKNKQLESTLQRQSDVAGKHALPRAGSVKPGTNQTVNKKDPTPSRTGSSITMQAADQVENIIRSKSGKVQILTHTASPEIEQVSNVSVRRHSQAESLNKSQLHSVTSSTIPEDMESIGTLTPLSVPSRQDGRLTRLLTAKTNNRLLTSNAHTLNERQAPSRLLTATSGRSMMSLTSAMQSRGLNNEDISRLTTHRRSSVTPSQGITPNKLGTASSRPGTRGSFLQSLRVESKLSNLSEMEIHSATLKSRSGTVVLSK